jgi:3',5'-cyclic AMP phosphodiesterase CpdA
VLRKYDLEARRWKIAAGIIRATKPDLVVISGDLTQRAHTEQFVEARNFLDAIPFPKIVSRRRCSNGWSTPGLRTTAV